jgi:hypothetical protein
MNQFYTNNYHLRCFKGETFIWPSEIAIITLAKTEIVDENENFTKVKMKSKIYLISST